MSLDELTTPPISIGSSSLTIEEPNVEGRPTAVEKSVAQFDPSFPLTSRYSLLHRQLADNSFYKDLYDAIVEEIQTEIEETTYRTAISKNPRFFLDADQYEEDLANQLNLLNHKPDYYLVPYMFVNPEMETEWKKWDAEGVAFSHRYRNSFYMYRFIFSRIWKHGGVYLEVYYPEDATYLTSLQRKAIRLVDNNNVPSNFLPPSGDWPKVGYITGATSYDAFSSLYKFRFDLSARTFDEEVIGGLGATITTVAKDEYGNPVDPETDYKSYEVDKDPLKTLYFDESINPRVEGKTLILSMTADKVMNLQDNTLFTDPPDCLQDIPFLQYIERQARLNLKTTEKAKVGTQLTLACDTSGYFIKGANSSYSMPDIHANVTVVKANWEENNEPSYLKLGVGRLSGVEFNSIFVRPGQFQKMALYGEASIYGDSIYSGVSESTLPSIAAAYCSTLVYGSFEDWYLPSKDELSTLFTNLNSELITEFETEFGSTEYAAIEELNYWSSSEIDDTTAYTHEFKEDTSVESTKAFLARVRPVRSFEHDSTTYAVGDTGPAGGLIFYVDTVSDPDIYYECALIDGEPAETSLAQFGGLGFDMGATGTDIGDGESNTNLIVTATAPEEAADIPTFDMKWPVFRTDIGEYEKGSISSTVKGINTLVEKIELKGDIPPYLIYHPEDPDHTGDEITILQMPHDYLAKGTFEGFSELGTYYARINAKVNTTASLATKNTKLVPMLDFLFDISDPTVIAPYDIEDRLLYNHEELRYFGSEKEDYPADLNTAWLELKTYLEADYDWPFASLTNPGEASSLVDLILTFDGATPDCHADVLAYLGVIENVDPDIAIDITEIPYIQTWITTTQLWFDFALVGEYTSGAVAPIDPSEAVAETKINWTGDTWNYRGWYRYVPQHIWRVYLTIQEEIDIITSWTSSYDYIIFNDQTFRDALRFYENVEQSSTTLLGDLDPRDKVLVLKDFFESLESGSVYAFTDTSSDDSLETVNEDHQGFFTPTYSGTNLNVPAVISATHLKIDDTYEYNYVLPNGETETRTGIELDTVRGWIKCKYIVESSDPDFKAYDAGASSNSMDTRVRGIDYSDSMYLRYVINTTKNFADMNDLNSQFVGITEAGIYNTEDKLIAYAHFPPVIYDSYVNHLAINWYISDTDFAYP